MATTFGALRRRFLAPSLADVSFAGRGFPGADSPVASRLEAVPQTVVCGFEWGIEKPQLWEIERRLSVVEPELRGFAYEGATMACTVLDGFAGGRGTRAKQLLDGPGLPHIFLAYIGIGFAMARLPRMLWKKVLPELEGSPYHPTMSWLAVDGYGFDRAYFDTHRVVERQEVLATYPWAGSPEYFPRAVDQGIGRALWFIHGARAGEVTRAVAAFDEHRQADLWSGVGLAATFAGGCAEADLAALRSAAGKHAPEVSLGAVFAVKARDYAEFVPGHTEAALRALAGLGVAEAVTLADATAVHEATGDGEPPYETWRRRIRAELAAVPPG